MIQHEIFRVVSRFPRYISCYTVTWKVDFLWDSVLQYLPVHGYSILFLLRLSYFKVQQFARANCFAKMLCKPGYLLSLSLMFAPGKEVATLTHVGQR